MTDTVQKVAYVYAEDAGGGRIDVTAVDAVWAGSGRFGAIPWVARRNFAKAAKLLGAG